jgi:hypothetical protein
MCCAAAMTPETRILLHDYRSGPYHTGMVRTYNDCVDMAREVSASGRARERLNHLLE